MALRRTLVLSDVHLTPREQGSGVDAALAPLLDRARLRAAAEPSSLEVVLAGDVFDLDAPPADRPADAATYAHVRSEPGAAETLARILDVHRPVVAALQRILAAGGSVVVLPGNHDSQLAFPAVRYVLARALPGSSVRSWFHLTPDVLVDHGHLYDPLAVLEDPRGHVDASGQRRLEDTVGSVGTHLGAPAFGAVDPFAPDPFADRGALRSGLADILQDAPLVLAAIRQVLLVSGSPDQGVRGRPPLHRSPDPLHPWLDRVAAQTGVHRAILDHHRTLWAPKADVRAPLLAATGEYDYGADAQIRQKHAMRSLAAMYPAAVIVMGHTHAPWVERLPSGQLLANSGAWVPDPSRPGRVRGTFVDLASDGRQVRCDLGTVT